MPTRLPFIVNLGIALLLCGSASAQLYDKPRPVSSTGGYAGRELRSIYARDVGQGFTGETINRMSLRQGTAIVPQVGQSTVTSGSVSLGPVGPTSKPFAGYTPSPTVSPYLNLFREDFDGSSDFNYQTLVRPQLQQQQINQQLQRQSNDLQRRLQSIAAQSNFNPQGSVSQPPTGHPTRFMYYGRYYPSMQRR